MKLYIPMEEYKKWKNELESKGILYLYGSSGLGKTTKALKFAERYYEKQEYITAKSSDFFQKLHEYIRNNDTKESIILILDDIHLLRNQQQQEELFQWLIAQNHKDSFIPIVLLSQGRFPTYLTPLRMTNLLTVVSAKHLVLPEEFIASHMEKIGIKCGLLAKELADAVESAVDFSKGNPVAYQTFYQHWCDFPTELMMVREQSQQDFVHYYEHFVFSAWEEEQQDFAIKLAAFPRLTKDGIDYVLGENALESLENLNQMYYFIEKKTEDEFYIEPIFLEFLRHKFSCYNEVTRHQLFRQMGEFYEGIRELEFALLAYENANCWDKIVEIIIFMCENASGCYFARIASQYMNNIPKEYEVGNHALLGAKIMICAYKMDLEQYEDLMEELRYLAYDQEQTVQRKEAQYIYMRTLIASPLARGQQLLSNLKNVWNVTSKNPEILRNIMPTGNYPSLINGGIDITELISIHRAVYPIMKQLMESCFGKEGIGVADACMGEMYYEQKKDMKALSFLTKALSDANLKGSLRVQYAITAIMARLFLSEGKPDTAFTTLENMKTKVSHQNFEELIPNLRASLVTIDLYTKHSDKLTIWMEKYAPDEHLPFYISDQFVLFTKAKVYVYQGHFIEAMFILELLENYARNTVRNYLLAEILVLRGIILYRLKKPWESTLVEGVSLLAGYHCVRIYADFGAALLPLWKEVNWNEHTNLKVKFLNEVQRELEKMAKYYPFFLTESEEDIPLTEKEKEILILVSHGLSNQEICEEMFVSVGTVKYHLGNINRKLEVDNRTAAVKVAKEKQLI